MGTGGMQASGQWSSIAGNAVSTGTKVIQAKGHRHPEETAEHCPHSIHRTEGCSIAFWHWESPCSPSLPRARWGLYSQHYKVPQKNGAALPSAQGQPEGPGTLAGNRRQHEEQAESNPPNFSPHPRVPKPSGLSPTKSPSLTLLPQPCLPCTRHHGDPGFPTSSEAALGLGEARSGLQCRGVSRAGCGMPAYGDELLRSPAGPQWSIMEFLLIVGGLPRDDAPSPASIN